MPSRASGAETDCAGDIAPPTISHFAGTAADDVQDRGRRGGGGVRFKTTLVQWSDETDPKLAGGDKSVPKPLRCLQGVSRSYGVVPQASVSVVDFVRQSAPIIGSTSALPAFHAHYPIALIPRRGVRTQAPPPPLALLTGSWLLKLLIGKEDELGGAPLGTAAHGCLRSPTPSILRWACCGPHGSFDHCLLIGANWVRLGRVVYVSANARR